MEIEVRDVECVIRHMRKDEDDMGRLITRLVAYKRNNDRYLTDEARERLNAAIEELINEMAKEED